LKNPICFDMKHWKRKKEKNIPFVEILVTLQFVVANGVQYQKLVYLKWEIQERKKQKKKKWKKGQGDEYFLCRYLIFNFMLNLKRGANILQKKGTKTNDTKWK